LQAFTLRLLEWIPPNVDSAQALSGWKRRERLQRIAQDRCIRLHDSLVAGEPPAEAMDSNDLAAGIVLLKQNRFYSQAKLLYDKGGLDLSRLSVGEVRRVNEAHAFCRRRLENEATPP
jgi:hypothetical protein